MWRRSELKERAREVLRFNYWKAFLVSFLLLIVGGREGGGLDFRWEDRSEDLIRTLGISLAALLGIISAFIILRALVGVILEVGGKKFYVKAAEGETNIGYLGYCFKDGRYFGVLAAMLLRGLYTFLWSLLLIIPGIIKAYAYRMVPYILADNPNIGASRAIELSEQMTDGEKWNIFVLDLSFIGWYILGSLALGIGVLFVMPYEDATNAELYLVLRRNAIESGITSEEELRITNTLSFE